MIDVITCGFCVTAAVLLFADVQPVVVFVATA
jgi:hypothetical protein